MIRLRLPFLLLFLLVDVDRSSAHELKVLASNPNCTSGGRVTVFLSWGHRLPVDDLVDGKSIQTYELISPKGARTKLKTTDYSLQANSVDIEGEGIHQAVVTRNPAVLTFVYDERGLRRLKRGSKIKHRGSKIDHAFRSQQVGNALIGAGQPGSTPVKSLGLPLEIVPIDGPSAWKTGSVLRFKVLHDGKPLGREEVVATYIGFQPNNAWSYSTTTNENGVATVRVSRGGTWVLCVRLRRAVTDSKEYDFEHLTSTLALPVR